MSAPAHTIKFEFNWQEANSCWHGTLEFQDQRGGRQCGGTVVHVVDHYVKRTITTSDSGYQAFMAKARREVIKQIKTYWT
jgi:hypothetical protein